MARALAVRKALSAPYRAPWFAALAILGPTVGLLRLWQLNWTRSYAEIAE